MLEAEEKEFSEQKRRGRVVTEEQKSQNREQATKITQDVPQFLFTKIRLKTRCWERHEETVNFI